MRAGRSQRILLLSIVIHRRFKIDVARIGSRILEGQDLRSPVSTDPVFPVNPEEAIRKAGPHQ